MIKRGWATGMVLVALVGFAACGTKHPSAASTTTSAPRLQGDIVVSAATSLTAAFTEIGHRFTALHPGVKVTFNFGASSALADQIIAGAPADVFASADEKNMAKLTSAGVAAAPTVFARNRLVIVTQPGNPLHIDGVAALDHAGVISLCAEAVPCGAYAKQILDTAGVTIPESSVTRGENVAATLRAVADGDAVAGIVYATDAAGAGAAVTTVTIPTAQNVIARYPIAAITASASARLARAFVAYVRAAPGQRVLTKFGFLRPV